MLSLFYICFFLCLTNYFPILRRRLAVNNKSACCLIMLSISLINNSSGLSVYNIYLMFTVLRSFLTTQATYPPSPTHCHWIVPWHWWQRSNRSLMTHDRLTVGLVKVCSGLHRCRHYLQLSLLPYHQPSRSSTSILYPTSSPPTHLSQQRKVTSTVTTIKTVLVVTGGPRTQIPLL